MMGVLLDLHKQFCKEYKPECLFDKRWKNREQIDTLLHQDSSQFDRNNRDDISARLNKVKFRGGERRKGHCRWANMNYDYRTYE